MHCSSIEKPEGGFISLFKCSISGFHLLVYPQAPETIVLGWQGCFPAACQVQLSKEASRGTQGMVRWEAEIAEVDWRLREAVGCTREASVSAAKSTVGL